MDGEFRRYKALAEGAIRQVDEPALSVRGPADQNSIAIIAWHVSGNLASRFTDFLTTDGEKAWRHRDEEFVERTVSRTELLEKWDRGWSVLFATLDDLTDADLAKTVHIRAQPVAVVEALHRALAHVSYHVGQIVLLGRVAAGEGWQYLSIAPGQSESYNRGAVKNGPPITPNRSKTKPVRSAAWVSARVGGPKRGPPYVAVPVGR